MWPFIEIERGLHIPECKPRPKVRYEPEVYDPKFNWYIADVFCMELIPTGRWALEETPDGFTMLIEASKSYRKNVKTWYPESAIQLKFKTIKTIYNCKENK